MNSKRSFEPHLELASAVLCPGAEWPVQGKGWSFLRIGSGIAYWLSPRCNHELNAGTALLLSERARGVLRASQLGEVSFHHFRLDPNRLTSVVTWGEQQALERAAAQESSAVRVFGPTTPTGESFQKICARQARSALGLRLKLLDLFVEAFGDGLGEELEKSGSADAKLRLLEVLNGTPAADFLEMSFGQLVRQVRCTPRHLSRIFHEVVGMSFRERQTQLRLVRAQELLATTETKVVNVAFESGYRSLSLFNLMFKRRFGVTPAKWRNKSSPAALSRSGAPRSALALRPYRIGKGAS
jgi:AraC-like DNA-binding protein